MSLWRRNARHDENHALVVSALRSCGCSVQSVNAAGAPDLVVGLLGSNYLVEIKRPLGARGGASGRELNPIQRAWHASWRGSKPWILRSPSDAFDWVQARRDEAKAA